MKNRVKFYMILGLVALWGVMVLNREYRVGSGVLLAQANLKTPQIAQGTTTALNVKWTAGTVNNGGHAVAVTAGSSGLTALQTDCSAPLYAACNIVYANSSGTVTVTATSSGIATATASGNTVLGYVETTQTAIAKLSYAQQASPVVTPSAVYFNCGTTVACSSPVGSTLNRSVGGAVTVASGSAVTIYGITPAYTSTSTYGCTVAVIGTTSSLVVPSVSLVSGTSIKLFVAVPTGAASETVNYVCRGY